MLLHDFWHKRSECFALNSANNVVVNGSSRLTKRRCLQSTWDDLGSAFPWYHHPYLVRRTLCTPCSAFLITLLVDLRCSHNIILYEYTSSTYIHTYIDWPWSIGPDSLFFAIWQTDEWNRFVGANWATNRVRCTQSHAQGQVRRNHGPLAMRWSLKHDRWRVMNDFAQTVNVRDTHGVLVFNTSSALYHKCWQS